MLIIKNTGFPLHGNDKKRKCLIPVCTGMTKELQGNDKMDTGFLFAWK